jgi:EAL domain-containing protein (putative c-di-GMP-specific phosphodiesterase class I)
MTVITEAMLVKLTSPHFLRPAYQPIVDLREGAIVGYEALARWPDLQVEPEEAFEASVRQGTVGALDWACQTQALLGALDAGLDRGITLFVNAEPGSFANPPPTDFLVASDRADRELRVVVELTERALLRSPAELLRTVAKIRSRGWGVAVDDVGTAPESLALVPFISPDVIKLDLRMVQRWPDAEQGRIMAAVMAHAERTGATILAEGIETDQHLEQALALGATIGQGWHFAAAGVLASEPGPAPGIPFLDPPGTPPVTPFDLVAGGDLRIGRKGLLLGITRHLEHQGMSLAPPPVVLAGYHLAGTTGRLAKDPYAQLALRCPLVAVFGDGLEAGAWPGVRSSSLAPDDPLRREWTVVVVGPHYAGALIARDLGDTGPDLERRFSFTVTHRRDLVVEAARSMLDRVGR